MASQLVWMLASERYIFHSQVLRVSGGFYTRISGETGTHCVIYPYQILQLSVVYNRYAKQIFYLITIFTITGFTKAKLIWLTKQFKVSIR
jgi:hypothetical protein